jgi:uncharacterized membrane protein
MAHGAVQLVAIEFEGSQPNADFAKELKRLVESGVIRIVDLLFVRKEQDGSVNGLEITDLGDDDGTLQAYDSTIDEMEGLVSDEDIEEIGEALSPGSMGMIAVFEHSWAHKIRAAIEASNGRAVYNEYIPGPVVDEVLAALSEVEE